MARKTYSMVVTDVRKMSLEPFNLPHISDEDGLLRVEMCGVCASDVGIYIGKDTAVQKYFPLIMGHEILGRIEEMGEKACLRHGVKKGDRVVVEYAFGCGYCRYCVSGKYIFCQNSGSYGYYASCKNPPHLWGAYGEYLYLPPRAKIHKISEEVPAEAGVLVCAVLGNAVRWIRHMGGVSIGDTVVIEGPGQQGLAGIVAAKHSGAGKIIVTGIAKDQRRFEMAKLLGADYCINVFETDPVKEIKEITAGMMADVVMDVTGKPEGAKTAINLVKKGGTIVLPGLYGSTNEVPLLLDKVVLEEIRLQGVFSHDITTVAPAIKLVESRKYPLERMVTHKFALKDAEMAVQTAGGEIEGEDPIKVAIIP